MSAPVVWCFHDAPYNLRSLFTERGTETWLARFDVPAEAAADRELQVANLALALHSDDVEIEGWVTDRGMVCCARVREDELLRAEVGW